MKTNIVTVLQTAAKSTTIGSYIVVDLTTGTKIDGLTVHHEKDHDYLIFEGTNEPQNTTWQTKFATVQYKIDTNPASKTKKDGIHLKINSILRSKISQLYDDLALLYDKSNADESVWGVLNSYSDLLKASKDKILNFQQQVGLVGELTVLLDLMDNGHGAKALDYWKGPEGGLHDFVNDNVWELEVKTSTYPSPVVKVHPIEQLEPIGLPFHLVVVKLKTDPTKGTTLPDWIKNVKGKLTTVKDKNRLDDLLLEVGYSDVDASKYKFAFIHEESIRYKIDATTETLCPLNIKAGVLYDDIRWTLQSSDYTMVACDPKFWKNPV